MQKSNCNQNVKKFVEQISWEDLYISAISVGEICYGVEELPAGKKKHELTVWLYTKLPEWFNRRIIALDTEVMLEWGKIRSGAGRTLPVIDSLIAASAITHHITLVTRNTKDFENIAGISLLNLWEFGN
jgi:predicted nucleic acid-binding protein